MEIGETVGIAASMGLQNLQHEPQRLLSEAERLNVELESLVMDNYRIFVENLTCSVHLRTEVNLLVLIIYYIVKIWKILTNHIIFIPFIS